MCLTACGTAPSQSTGADNEVAKRQEAMMPITMKNLMFAAKKVVVVSSFCCSGRLNA